MLNPQLFPAITETVPPVVSQWTVMEGVFWPSVMTAPAGTVQEYEVAPETGLIV